MIIFDKILSWCLKNIFIFYFVKCKLFSKIDIIFFIIKIIIDIIIVIDI